uniref:Uncharacterized protein n=1 Tax=Anguilla anguilla TaxID=7936 RepID=A0A0E9WE20_ANGAN
MTGQEEVKYSLQKYKVQYMSLYSFQRQRTVVPAY